MDCWRCDMCHPAYLLASENAMTKPQLLRMMRLLSAMECLMLSKDVRAPDYLYEELSQIVEWIEKEILKGEA